MGWRYYCFSTGGLILLLWTVRFAMPLLESPRFLLGKGQDMEAVEVVHKLAKINGKTSSLTAEQLLVVERNNLSEMSVSPVKRDMRYIWDAFRHFKGFFATPKMALSTVLLFLITCACSTSPLIPLRSIQPKSNLIFQFYFSHHWRCISRSYHLCELPYPLLIKSGLLIHLTEELRLVEPILVTHHWPHPIAM